MIKRMSLLRRKPDMTEEAFDHHWFEIHSPLIAELPGLRHYVQNKPTGKVGGAAQIPVADADDQIDGITELYFDSLEDMEAAYTSEQGKKCFADGQLFIGSATTFTVVERVIKDW